MCKKLPAASGSWGRGGGGAATEVTKHFSERERTVSNYKGRILPTLSFGILTL